MFLWPWENCFNFLRENCRVCSTYLSGLLCHLRKRKERCPLLNKPVINWEVQGKNVQFAIIIKSSPPQLKPFLSPCKWITSNGSTWMFTMYSERCTRVRTDRRWVPTFWYTSRGRLWGRKTAISYGFRTMWVWHWPDAGEETKGFTSCIMLPCHQKSTFSLHSCDTMSWHGQTTKEKNRSWQTQHTESTLWKGKVTTADGRSPLKEPVFPSPDLEPGDEPENITWDCSHVTSIYINDFLTNNKVEWSSFPEGVKVCCGVLFRDVTSSRT